MITNDLQYRTAKTQADRLDRLVTELSDRPIDSNNGEIRRKLEVMAVEGQLQELRGQLTEYDALREGRTPVGELSSLDDLPRLLVRARIAAGLSQRSLAERLGLKEQQIQRYESTDYGSASLSRLRQVAAALSLSETYIPQTDVDSSALIKQLVDLGLDRTFVRRRIAPAALRESPKKGSNLAPVIDLASRVGRVFGMDASSLLSGERIESDHHVLAAASFKMPKGTTSDRVAAYTVYAHYVALVALQATESIPRAEVPSDPVEFRALWQKREPGNSFESLLRFVWGLGIPVVPLADAGGFHAAVWKSHGREVIVLKQGARRSSRWAFDLLHEIGHILSGLDGANGGVIDGDDMSIDEGEQEANQFAGDVLLDGRAEALVQRCVDEAKGSVERLKGVVPRVASSEHVDTSALANYLAFRLSLTNSINWWGAATNLQSADDDPWSMCRDVLIGRADLASLNPLDRDLLKQALVP
jgi:transcriptional regulator with XRE-family HTH domain